MAAVTSQFLAGHYEATYDNTDIGTTEVGFNLNRTWNREDIRVDDFGDTVVDAIYRGYSLSIDFQLSSWSVVAIDKLMHPFSGTMGVVTDVGQAVFTVIAKELVLTPVTGINDLNLTYTFPRVVPDRDHGSFSLNTKLRRFRCSFLVLTNEDGGEQYNVG